jgi:superfamily I DNA/RNA helicase
VFNKENAEKSKKEFGSNTKIDTVHGFAYKEIAKQYSNIQNDDYSLEQILNILNIDNMNIAYDIKMIIKIYCNSSYELINDVSNDYVAKEIISFKYAVEFYNLMKDNKIAITHSFYLKEFSLHFNPKRYKYDFVLLDEAQDTNEVTLNIFNKFDSKKILVGDKHQAIYKFRGAVNAMDKVKTNYSLFLSQTFRCSQNIVDYANYILKTFKNETVELVSSKVSNSIEDKTTAYITRTNSQIIFLISKFDEFHIYTTPQKLFKTAIQIHYFLTNKFEKLYDEFKYLIKYKNRDNLLEYATEYNDVNLISAIRVATIFKGYLFVLQNKAIQQNNKNSMIKILTAHTSKGLEFENVVIDTDFKQLSKIEDLEHKEEEANLFYVAITRAKSNITFSKKDGFNGYI